MWLFALFILWPLAEISLFVTLGGWLGLWLSLAIVIGTAALGILVVRMQGMQVNETVRSALRNGQDPTKPVAFGALRVLAGVLLILPGFLTDIIGILLLLPPVQIALMALLSRRAQRPLNASPTNSPVPDILEGDWKRIDTPNSDQTGGSGWTRH